MADVYPFFTSMDGILFVGIAAALCTEAESNRADIGNKRDKRTERLSTVTSQQQKEEGSKMEETLNQDGQGSNQQEDPDIRVFRERVEKMEEQAQKLYGAIEGWRRCIRLSANFLDSEAQYHRGLLQPLIKRADSARVAVNYHLKRALGKHMRSFLQIDASENILRFNGVVEPKLHPNPVTILINLEDNDQDTVMRLIKEAMVQLKKNWAELISDSWSTVCDIEAQSKSVETGANKMSPAGELKLVGHLIDLAYVCSDCLSEEEEAMLKQEPRRVILDEVQPRTVTFFCDRCEKQLK